MIGEGGSGGALAIGVGDRVLMLQYSHLLGDLARRLRVASCGRARTRKKLAAEAMGITAERLCKLKLVDEVMPEPLGGAHRDPAAMADALKDALIGALAELEQAAARCAARATPPSTRGVRRVQGSLSPSHAE